MCNFKGFESEFGLDEHIDQEPHIGYELEVILSHLHGAKTVIISNLRRLSDEVLREFELLLTLLMA